MRNICLILSLTFFMNRNVFSEVESEPAARYVSELSHSALDKTAVIYWGKGISTKDSTELMSTKNEAFAHFYIMYLWMINDHKSMDVHVEILRSKYPKKYNEFCYEIFRKYPYEKFESEKSSLNSLKELETVISNCTKKRNSSDPASFGMYKGALKLSLEHTAAKTRYLSFVKSHQKYIDKEYFEIYFQYQ